jgi:hypothetical protein
MSYVPIAVTELLLIGVVDAGVPNKERIVLRPTQTTDLKQFLLAPGIFNPSNGGARPIFDNAFWFPDVRVDAPSWIHVYTGLGNSRIDSLPGGEPVHTFFWQRKSVIFTYTDVLPVLIRFDAAIVGNLLS